MDVGCYCVSGSRLLAGEPELVFGAGARRRLPAPTGSSPRRCATRAACSRPSTAARRSTDRDELEAVGSEGSLFLDDPWHARTPVIEIRRDDGVERIETEPADSYRLELENLSDAIRGEAEPLLGRADAVAQARALEALHRSAQSGQPVEP